MTNDDEICIPSLSRSIPLYSKDRIQNHNASAFYCMCGSFSFLCSLAKIWGIINHRLRQVSLYFRQSRKWSWTEWWIRPVNPPAPSRLHIANILMVYKVHNHNIFVVHIEMDFVYQIQISMYCIMRFCFLLTETRCWNPCYYPFCYTRRTLKRSVLTPVMVHKSASLCFKFCTFV